MPIKYLNTRLQTLQLHGLVWKPVLNVDKVNFIVSSIRRDHGDACYSL